MLLIFALIWSCSAAVNSVPHIAATNNLLQIARRDPEAFAAMFNTAPKEKVLKIVELLQALIDTAELDIKSITGSLQKAKDDLKITGDNLVKKTTECKVFAKSLKTAQEKEKVDLGVYQEHESALAADEGNLLDEIATLKGVIKTLENLKTSPKELVSNSRHLLASLQYQDLSFLSALEKIDPESLDEVINLLKGLIGDAEASLQGLRENVNKAKATFEEAVKVSDKAEVDSTDCDEEEVGMRGVVKEAEGTKDAAQTVYDDRFGVLTKEIETIRSVIKILNGML